MKRNRGSGRAPGTNTANSVALPDLSIGIGEAKRKAKSNWA